MIVLHNLSTIRVLLAMSAVLFGFGGRAAAAQTFKDCSHCPQMVKVPAGTFIMGSPFGTTIKEGAKDEFVVDERPEHSVTIGRELAVGKYAVTRGEFAAFIKDTGYNAGSKCAVYAGNKYEERSGRSWRNPGYAQTDRHPVVRVSFEDAQHYVQWLSRKTGQLYRLPTEAEWEYAARANTTTARFWGDDRERACDFANVADLTGAERWNWDTTLSSTVTMAIFIRRQLALFAPMHLVCTTCWAMFGNGWKTVTTQAMTEHRPMVLRGPVASASIASSAAVPGTTLQGPSALRFG